MDQPGGQRNGLTQFVQLFPLGFQALLIQGVALHQIVFQALGSPLAELHATLGFHPIPHGNHHVQIVVFHVALHLPGTFRLNYPEFPDSCLPAQFALVEHVTDVLVDGSHILVEQGRHLPLVEPYGFLLQGDLELHLAILCLEYLDFVVFRHGFISGRWIRYPAPPTLRRS